MMDHSPSVVTGQVFVGGRRVLLSQGSVSVQLPTNKPFLTLSKVKPRLSGDTPLESPLIASQARSRKHPIAHWSYLGIPTCGTAHHGDILTTVRRWVTCKTCLRIYKAEFKQEQRGAVKWNWK